MNNSFVSGSKLFRAGDKLASVLKSHQLLEMRIGETEIKYSDQGLSDMFAEIKDLVQKCLAEEASARISARDVLDHDFLKRDLTPTVKDMVILPSNVMLLMHILKDQITDEERKGKAFNLAVGGKLLLSLFLQK